VGVDPRSSYALGASSHVEVCGGPDLPTQKYSVFSPHWNSNLIDFYSCTELHKKQIKLSNYSLLHSILADTTSTSQILSSNHYQALFNIDDCDDTMEIDSPTDSQSHTKTKVVSWSTDAGVSTLTEELFSHMTERKQLAEDTGDYDEFPEYKTPE